MLAPWKKSSDKPRRRIKKQRHLFADQGPYSQSYGFPSSHIGIWELDHKELMLYEALMKTWCFQIVVLEKTLENPLDSREIKLVHPKGYQPWIFIGRTVAEALITLATWCEEPTHWKRPRCWERLKAGEGHHRGWDGWMASLTQCIRVWANSRRWWRTG